MSVTFPHPDALQRADSQRAASCLREQGFVRLSAAALAEIAGTPSEALQALGTSWRELPADEHLKDGGRYRRRRHGSLVQDTRTGRLETVPHRPHWQPTTYNALHGGMLRHFAPLDAAMAASPAFLALVARLGEVFAAAAHDTPTEPAFDGRWFIEAHPFRIDTTGGGSAGPRRRARTATASTSSRWCWSTARACAAARRASSRPRARTACASRSTSPGARCCSTIRGSFTRARRSSPTAIAAGATRWC